MSKQMQLLSKNGPYPCDQPQKEINLYILSTIERSEQRENVCVAQKSLGHFALKIIFYF